MQSCENVLTQFKHLAKTPISPKPSLYTFNKFHLGVDKIYINKPWMGIYLSTHSIFCQGGWVGQRMGRVGLYVGMKASDTQTDTIVFIIWIFSCTWHSTDCLLLSGVEFLHSHQSATTTSTCYMGSVFLEDFHINKYMELWKFYIDINLCSNFLS